MSLYDDILDTSKEKSDQVSGWASGIKLLQTQLQLKKASLTQVITKREQVKKQTHTLAPVIDLKTKKEEIVQCEPVVTHQPTINSPKLSKENRYPNPQATFLGGDPEWHIQDEYDPLRPNEYEKVVKDIEERNEFEKQKGEEEKRFKDIEEREKRKLERFNEGRVSGFSKLRESDDEEEEGDKPKRLAGAAIAPPPSLLEDLGQAERSASPPAKPILVGNSNNSVGVNASSVAAKIMAKYGFKEGQGLGKQEQGIAVALAVEKTSKRGGRIIDAKELMPPPPPPTVAQKQEQSITEMMKNPSKAVLLKNMVGPGEVDEFLEPEVKEECNGKYGDVTNVIIYETPDVCDEEAVRIFVEFKRIESAIKAVVDLNGRYFGGRQVKAGFYDAEKLKLLQLSE